MGLLHEAVGILLRALYPVTPHITHALWNELGFAARFATEIIDAPWPQADEAALVTDEIELVVQVNGKLRSSIRVPAAADKATIERAAVADAGVQKYVAGQPVKRVIVVPGKLVNVDGLRCAAAPCSLPRPAPPPSAAAASGCAARRPCRSTPCSWHCRSIRRSERRSAAWCVRWGIILVGKVMLPTGVISARSLPGCS